MSTINKANTKLKTKLEESRTVFLSVNDAKDLIRTLSNDTSVKTQCINCGSTMSYNIRFSEDKQYCPICRQKLALGRLFVSKEAKEAVITKAQEERVAKLTIGYNEIKESEADRLSNMIAAFTKKDIL